MGNRETVLDFLRSIAPNSATNAEIVSRTGIKPHAQVFQITRSLANSGLINSRQFGKDWMFWAVSGLDENVSKDLASLKSLTSELAGSRSMSAAEFELMSQKVMSQYFGVALKPGQVAGVPKRFDLVSADGQIVGDAKFYTLVRGEGLPSAKHSVIAEYVWLLGKTAAARRFLVFGNDRAVPEGWLKRYGSLSSNVEFFYISDAAQLSKL